MPRMTPTRTKVIVWAAAAAVVMGACSGSANEDATPTGGTVELVPATTQLPDSDDRVAAVNITATLNKLFEAEVTPIEQRLALVEGGAALETLITDLQNNDPTIAKLRPKVIEIVFETPEACAANNAAAGCATVLTDLYINGTKVFPNVVIVMNPIGGNEFQVSRQSYCGLLAYKQVTCPAP